MLIIAKSDRVQYNSPLELLYQDLLTLIQIYPTESKFNIINQIK